MDDILVFIDDEVNDLPQETQKVLIVDDDEGIHTISRIALQNKIFDGKKLEIISAMSAKEAKEILAQHDDIAMALIDVVMETPDAGLELVNYIRNDMGNSFIRLVLRTGQPDQIPESEIIDLYDINDYKEKTELTEEKLYTLVRLSIKQYEQIKKLQHQEKLLLIKTQNSQMGEMLSMIAHQWRQPLGAISGIINNLKIKLLMQDYDESFLITSTDDIENLLQHLSQTISDFRNFYLPHKKKTTFVVKTILDKSIELIKQTLESFSIELIIMNSSSKQIHSFESELQQVVLNIIKNSEDVLVSNKTVNPEILINCFDKDDLTYIQISDNAGGIKPSVMDNIFDPYFTTKENTNGTGLGLYMSKIIIEEHCKGSLSVKNTAEGAVFTVEIKNGETE